MRRLLSNIQNTEVDKEVTAATPNSRKKHRPADAAAYSTTLPLQYFAITQIEKTGKVNYEKYTLDSDGPTN